MSKNVLISRKPMPDILREKLNDAHAALRAASTVASLLQHESVDDIAEVVNCLETMFERLEVSFPNNLP